MTFSPLAFRLSYLLPLLVGLFLLVLAGLASRARTDRRAAPLLAAFLAAVGANQVLDAVAHWDTPRAVAQAGILLAILDPALILLFAAHLHRRPRPWAQALALLPPALLAGIRLLQGRDPAWMTEWPYRWVYAAEAGAYYLASFVLLAWAYRSGGPAGRIRRGVLVAALGAVLLTRVPLLMVDLGMLRDGMMPAPFVPLLLCGGAAALAAAAAALLLQGTSGAARTDASGVAARLAILTALVGAAWLLFLAPPLRDIAFSFWYSIRWLVFSIALTLGVRRHDLFGLGERAGRAVQAGLVALAAMLAMVVLWATLSGRPGAGLWGTLGATLGLAAVAAGAGAFLWYGLPGEREADRGRRWSLYRLHAQAGAGDAELERMRRRLGLTRVAARRLRRLARLDREAPPAAAAADWSPGGVVAGRYEIRRLLGTGRFGRSFAAWDSHRGEPVVVKELQAEWQAEEGALDRFLAEARLAMRVSHPALVEFRELQARADSAFLVFGHVAGETLRARLDRGPLPAAAARRVARDLLGALGAMHRAGLVHGDVKPENVVVRPDGGAVLIDFGGARIRRRRTLAAPGLGRGTVGYLSPEEEAGERLTPRSDLYGLGLVLWEACAGRPHPAGGVDPAWRAVLARALQRDPRRRWPSAAAMAKGLPGPAPPGLPRGGLPRGTGLLSRRPGRGLRGPLPSPSNTGQP